MSAIFKRLSHDPDVRCVVLTGAGERAFTAGLDVQVSPVAVVSRKVCWSVVDEKRRKEREREGERRGERDKKKKSKEKKATSGNEADEIFTQQAAASGVLSGQNNKDPARVRVSDCLHNLALSSPPGCL